MSLAAIDFDAELTPEEEQQFDQILEPVMKIYKFFKYAATVVGVLMLVFAAITLATSGGDTGKKEKAKLTIMAVIGALVLIWVAPFVVTAIFG